MQTVAPLIDEQLVSSKASDLALQNIHDKIRFNTSNMSKNQKKKRFFCWAKEEEIQPKYDEFMLTFFFFLNDRTEKSWEATSKNRLRWQILQWRKWLRIIFRWTSVQLQQLETTIVWFRRSIQDCRTQNQGRSNDLVEGQEELFREQAHFLQIKDVHRRR